MKKPLIITTDTREKVVDLYLLGISTRVIAARTLLPVGVVRRLLVEAGYEQPESYYVKPGTPRGAIGTIKGVGSQYPEPVRR